MTKEIFPVHSVDRRLTRWEDHLLDLTPVEDHRGVWFKRDDLFLPLGAGGLGGSKCRQLIWQFSRFLTDDHTHVLTGASIQSPQLLMSAIVGRHFGLSSRLVVYSEPETVLRHASPRIAHGFGASFEFASCPYNPSIQSKVRALTTKESFVVHYGITLDHKVFPVEDVRAFHEVGAQQTHNIPEEVETVIFPSGSCNSICSFLLGLHRDSKNVREVFALQIGPDKRKWLYERLRLLGVDPDALPFKLAWHSLHDTRFSRYSDKMPEVFDGIAFHPTYEGKIIRWLRDTCNWPAPDGKTLFWIVGSEPNSKSMEPFFSHAS